MAYEVIDERLKLWSCGIADLRLDQVKAFLELWNDGSNIGALTVFYDSENERVVINRDHRFFDRLVCLCKTYLVADEEVRFEIKKKFEGTSLQDEISVLDSAIWKMKTNEMTRLLNHQPKVPEEYDITYQDICALRDLHEPYYMIVRAFKYGIMQGKKDRTRSQKSKGIRLIRASFNRGAFFIQKIG